MTTQSMTSPYRLKYLSIDATNRQVLTAKFV